LSTPPIRVFLPPASTTAVRLASDSRTTEL